MVVVGHVVVTVVASLTPVVGWSSWLSTWVVVDTLSTKVVVVGCVAVVNVGGGGCVIDTGGGVVVVSCHCRPRHPPPRCPHPPRGAGWWWWGHRHHCAPCLSHAPCRRSCPHRCLVVMPISLLVVNVSPWHWPWTSHCCCCCCCCVNAGRVVGLPSIVLSSSSCPSLSSSCPSLSLSSPLPSSSLSHHCPPCLPLVVVVRD